MLKGFKDFLMRGNVVDLAVVIGAAFAKVVGGLLQGVINPHPLVNFVGVAAGIYRLVVTRFYAFLCGGTTSIGIGGGSC